MSEAPAHESRRSPLGFALLLGLFVVGVGAFIYFLVPKEIEQDGTFPAPRALASAGARPAAVKVGIKVGDRAPDFQAPLLRETGGTLRLTDLRGKAVMMNFWASWCGPCRAEARDLEATYRRYKERGLVFLGVDIVQDTWEDAMAFVKEFGITYPMVRDVTGKVTEMYQIANLPTTYFIDRDSIIRAKYLGGFLGDASKRELSRRIESLLR